MNMTIYCFTRSYSTYRMMLITLIHRKKFTSFYRSAVYFQEEIVNNTVSSFKDYILISYFKSTVVYLRRNPKNRDQNLLSGC